MFFKEGKKSRNIIHDIKTITTKGKIEKLGNSKDKEMIIEFLEYRGYDEWFLSTYSK